MKCTECGKEIDDDFSKDMSLSKYMIISKLRRIENWLLEFKKQMDKEGMDKFPHPPKLR